MSSMRPDRKPKPRAGSRVDKPKKETKRSTGNEELRSSLSPAKEIARKEKYRSGSLSRYEPVRKQETPKKSQSVDRNQSSRNNPLSQAMKADAVRRKSNDLVKKPISTSISKNANRRTIAEKTSTIAQKIKASEKPSKTTKSTKAKTNVEIAKSFVKNAKSNASVKSTDKKSSEKKSSKVPSYEADLSDSSERPRTSTIRKGPSQLTGLHPSETENSSGLITEIETHKSKEKVKSSTVADDDEKSSYEDDFEEYDSDFEESDTDSVSDTASADSVTDDDDDDDDDDGENILTKEKNSFESSAPSKPQKANDEPKKILAPAGKNGPKNFLKMSDRSSLYTSKDAEKPQERKPMKLSRSFINFASALEQEEKRKYSNRVLKRATELLEIITLDVVSNDLIDIPPMKYDTYIRTFGKSDSKQVFVQTENYEDEEIQTDEMDKLDKWTQNPPNDALGYGGDNVSTLKESEKWKSLFSSQSSNLSSFLKTASNVILTLLDEEVVPYNKMKPTNKRSGLFYSDGYHIISPLEFLKDSPILNMYSCSELNHYIVTIHDGMLKVPSEDVERGIICVWNILHNQKPEHILVANSQPTCATFAPMSSDLLIAGMVDGAVMLWDLLGSSYSHNKFIEQVPLHSPTYNTAVILGKENHRSCVVAVQTVHSSSRSHQRSISSEKSGGMKSFHVLTLEDMGVVNVWVAVEVLKPDVAGLETDLGLAPGGRFRLVRSSHLPLYSLPTLGLDQKVNIRTFDFRLIPFDANRILVTTDVGIILHVTRQSGSANPRFYSSDSDFSSEVRCMDCSPHNEDMFLVGCSDGSARLYNLKLARPLIVFPQAAKGDPVICLQWSPIHPTIFCVLSSSSQMHFWNLTESSIQPVNSYHFSDSRITWFLFLNTSRNYTAMPSASNYNMLISKETGEIELHVFQQKISEEDYRRQIEYMKGL